MQPTNRLKNKPPVIAAKTPANPGGSDGMSKSHALGASMMSNNSGAVDQTIMDTSGFGYINHNN